jgi:peptidoglycan/xylan/chitin deacetylase (PgdA/CDA1 family)
MWKEKGRCAIAIGFDFDAETLSLARGTKSASPVSRGKYGAYVGMPRVLKFLRERNMKITFFVPGWVAENYPWIMEDILRDGHEIAHHGWLHDDPNSMSVEQEREEFLRGIEVFKQFGVKPVGYRSPAFDLGPGTLDLLKSNDYIYDTSMMAHETPYFIHDDRGNSGIIELPVSWELDDAPYYIYLIKPTYRAGLRNPDEILHMWKKEFIWAYRDSGFYLLTLHPQLSGRGPRLDMIGQLIDYINQFPDVWFATHKEIATWYKTSVDEDKQLHIDIRIGKSVR